MITKVNRQTFMAYISDIERYAKLVLEPNVDYRTLIRLCDLMRDTVDHAESKEAEKQRER